MNASQMPEGSFDPIAYINTPRWSHSSLGLDRIQLLLEKLGNPQDKLQVIHVAGTNGKGSTCAYIANTLQMAGFKTALFTSPYIECFEERIQIDGMNISVDDLREVTLSVRDAATQVEAENGEHPTEFELMAAVAFLYFAQQGVDVAVVEVGLGGTLDATNVVKPTLCVITRIGLDHTDILGDTLALIAGEKAGIIKPGIPVISWPQEPEAMRVIQTRCDELRCSLKVADFSRLDVGPIDPTNFKRQFAYQGTPYQTSLIASYQPCNAAVAIEAIEEFSMLQNHDLPADKLLGLKDVLPYGIASTEWPGRFEIVCKEPLIVIDGSHNPQGAYTLADTMQDLEDALVARGEKTYPALNDGELPEVDVIPHYIADHPLDEMPSFGEENPLVQGVSAGSTFACKEHTLVMGVLADKEYVHIIEPLLPYARRFVVYTPPNPRALAAADLADAIHAQAPAMEVIVCETPAEAIATAVDLAEPNSMILTFGTLYAIGAIKEALRSEGICACKRDDASASGEDEVSGQVSANDDAANGASSALANGINDSVLI